MDSLAEGKPKDQSDALDDLTPMGLIAILATVILADFTLYHGHGYTGIGVFLLGAIAMLVLGKPRRALKLSLWIVGGMITLVVVHLVWYGSPLLVVIGFVLVITFATTLDGRPPYLLNVLSMGSQAFVAGFIAIADRLFTFRMNGRRWHHAGSLSLIMPVIAFALFGAIFVLANPDAVSFVGRQLEAFLSKLSEWLIHIAIRPTQPIFWMGVAIIMAGLLHPIFRGVPLRFVTSNNPAKVENTPLYSAYRNTLVTVIVLFAGYLTYEFLTFWTRKFPAGFHYSGYAHEGAAWLTIALALATLLLSLVFSGRVLGDPRLPTLRTLAWIWSLENILLSLSVYNRLFIYIDFNGMTRMRIVGLFGISVVVVGFLLVVWKILYGKNFPWLIHRQVWALALAIYLFALLPVDWIAANYNVNRILDGDISASMQIGVHQLDLEGVMALPPLLDSSDSTIREGVAAIIADRYWRLEAEYRIRQENGWTAFQRSDAVALKQFEAIKDKWKAFGDQNLREAAIQRFYTFAYQWY